MPSLRPAIAADLPAFQAIYADAVLHGTASYEIDPPDLAEMTRRYETVRDGGYPWLTAEDGNGTVLGYAYAGAFRPRPAYRFMVEDSIYVAPEAKGRGVGKALLRGLVEACRTGGYRQILAVIGDAERNPASIALHESLGFSPCGLIAGSGYKHGRWLDTALMQLALNGGRSTPPG